MPTRRSWIRSLLLLALAAFASAGATCEEVPGEAVVISDGDSYQIRGVLTGEGAECPALRAANGDLFTLSGSLEGFKKGDRVCVRGRPAEMSFCQQGTTIAIDWIGRDCGDPVKTR